MDKQVSEGTVKGRKGRGSEEAPVVTPEASVPARSAGEQFRDIQARLAAAQAELSDLANRCAAKGVTQLVIDGRTFQVRKERGSDGHYFYDPTSRPAREKAAPAAADEILV